MRTNYARHIRTGEMLFFSSPPDVVLKRPFDFVVWYPIDGSRGAYVRVVGEDSDEYCKRVAHAARVCQHCKKNKALPS